MSQYFLNSLQFDTAKIRHQAALQKLDQELFGGKGQIFQLSSEQVDEALVKKIEDYLKQGSIPENLEYFATQFPELKINLDNVNTVKGKILELHRHTDRIRKLLAASSNIKA